MSFSFFIKIGLGNEIISRVPKILKLLFCDRNLIILLISSLYSALVTRVFIETETIRKIK